MNVSKLVLLSAVLLLTACTGLLVRGDLDRLYGAPNPQRYDTPATSTAISYRHDVQPILEQRCAVCHGCYDAPCQLKLTAWEGVARGATKKPVYDGERLLAADPERLFEDAQRASDWRKRDFHAVLNERADTPEANLAGSALAQLLLLKERQPLPASPLLPPELPLGLYAKHQCPRVEELTAYELQTPLGGMPYGLPALPEGEQRTLLDWVAAGAPGEAAPALSPLSESAVAAWESFFNGSGIKQQLVARYLYEHLFLAHLYFGDEETQPFFRLVRSRTPPGEPISLIATRRPFDDPLVEGRIYYRLRVDAETTLEKTHMPYRLDARRRAFWQALFLDPAYDVTALPSYEPEVAANPFISFREIPVHSRYRFLLDEAEFTIMGFIKGPVCRGQMALNVIRDRFWVFFVNPELSTTDSDAQFLASQSEHLRLPVEEESNAPALITWLRYSGSQKKYLAARNQYLPGRINQLKNAGLNLIWDGDGRNDNATLTVFRHFDNATVLRGLIGEEPETVWVLSYPILERIHYLLVAGFDVYGNLGHQLNTRLYMDFLRMESEFNFLALLPEQARIPLRDRWYRDTPDHIREYVYGSANDFDQEIRIDFKTSNPKGELLQLLARKLGPVAQDPHAVKTLADPALAKSLEALRAVQGRAVSWLPQVVMIKVLRERAAPVWVTLVNNSAHSNVAHLFSEQDRRLPDEDNLTVLTGLIGSYPNAFWELSADRIPELTARIAALASEDDYRRLMDVYGVRRTNERFWVFSDEAHAALRAANGASFGLLDYNRLDNR